MTARVVATAGHGAHAFSKPLAPEGLTLIAGLGVEGDAHCGAAVRHRSRVKRDPTQPNLRQVHLIQSELFAELAGKGFAVAPGAMGENLTTEGIDLLALPTGALLRVGETALLAVTGLRNPCAQIEAFAPGLLQAVLDRDAAGGLVRKAGVMAVVIEGGVVRPGDPIALTLPPGPLRPLAPV